MTNKIVAIQGNHPSKLNPKTDTSVFLANEIQKKKYRVFYYDPKDLSIIDAKVIAKGFFIKFNYKDKKFYKIQKKQNLNLIKCKFILIDPKMLDTLLHPTLDPKADKDIIAKGLPASPCDRLRPTRPSQRFRQLAKQSQWHDRDDREFASLLLQKLPLVDSGHGREVGVTYWHVPRQGTRSPRGGRRRARAQDSQKLRTRLLGVGAAMVGRQRDHAALGLEVRQLDERRRCVAVGHDAGHARGGVPQTAKRPLAEGWQDVLRWQPPCLGDAGGEGRRRQVPLGGLARGFRVVKR